MSRRVVPVTHSAMLDFYLTHAAAWQTDPGAVGLTPEVAAAVREAVEAATAARNVGYRLRQQMLAATLEYRRALAQLGTVGSAAMSMIRAHAEVTGDESIYPRAQIPPPRRPTRAPEPVSPTDLSAHPLADGTIRLKWRGTVALNQSFEVLRSVDEGPRVFLAGMRTKEWVDQDVPAQVRSIRYQVYSVRGGKRSARATTASVRFGTREGQAAGQSQLFAAA